MVIKKKPPAKKSKKAPRKAKASTKPVPSLPSPDAVEPAAPGLAAQFHGVDVIGDAKKGGTMKQPVAAMLSLDQIKVIKGFNPRSEIGDTESLAKSIKADGLLSSLVVRPSAKGGTFDLIAGERRYRALQSLEWKAPVLVTIRSDLLGDDDRALAVAVAENSEDGRTNLNPIELGRVCLKLQTENKWDVSRIARECGLHPQKVRRVLALMEAPEAVRKKIESGDVSLNAGIELSRLDEKTREDVVKAMLEEGGAQTAVDIKRIRKQVETSKSIEDAATSGTKKTKKGSAAKRTPTAWRGSRDKQVMLQTLCHALSVMERDDGDAEFIETRAMVCVLLWDRGDLQSLEIPAESDTDAASKKALKALWAMIAQEAAKHEVSDEDAEDAEDAEPAEDSSEGDGDEDGDEEE